MTGAWEALRHRLSNWRHKAPYQMKDLGSPSNKAAQP